MCKQNSKSDILIYRGLDIPPKGSPKQKLFLQKKKKKTQENRRASKV